MKKEHGSVRSNGCYREDRSSMQKHAAQNKRFRAEVFDKLQFLLEEYRYNDHQIHCVISFSGKLNKDLLKRAVFLSMEAVPILGSRYVVNTREPYWQSLEKSQYEKAIAFVDSNNFERDLNKLLVSKTQALEGPQVKLTLLCGPDHDVLNVVMNHMVCDAAGFKQYLYLLASTYSNLIQKPDYHPESRMTASRSIGQIFHQFNIMDRVKLLFLPRDSKDSEYQLNSEQNGSEEPRPYMQLYKLPQTHYSLLKKYCKEHNFTVNDVILAAYYRTLYRLLDINRDISLNISCTVDLRRYLPGKKAQALCNLSSWILCDIIPGEQETFEDTAGRVHDVMESRKKSFPGLNGLATLPLVFRLFPYARAKELIREKMHYPRFAMTNIGIIDKTSLVFADTPVTDAFMTGSIKYPTHFQIGLTTFSDTITFSLNLNDCEHDRELISRFYNLFIRELMDNIDDPCAGHKVGFTVEEAKEPGPEYSHSQPCLLV